MRSRPSPTGFLTRAGGFRASRCRDFNRQGIPAVSLRRLEFLTRAGGFRASRCRDFNRQGNPAVSLRRLEFLTRAGGLRASRCRDFNRQGDSPTGCEESCLEIRWRFKPRRRRVQSRPVPTGIPNPRRRVSRLPLPRFQSPGESRSQPAPTGIPNPRRRVSRLPLPRFQSPGESRSQPRRLEQPAQAGAPPVAAISIARGIPQSACADLEFLTRAGGLRASRCRDFNRQGNPAVSLRRLDSNPRRRVSRLPLPRFQSPGGSTNRL
jgi:hypothetical protein